MRKSQAERSARPADTSGGATRRSYPYGKGSENEEEEEREEEGEVL